MGAELLVESVAAIVADPRAVEPQDDRRATYAPKLGPADRILAWTDPARSLVDRCRALSPEPGALTTFRGDALKVLRGRAVPGSGEPGRIVSVGRGEVVVATGEGGFVPLEVVPAGRRRMSGADVVNGLRPGVGERLG
jgi:methionyl-tRNA formyltransferase